MINKVSNYQMAGITAGSTIAGVGAGYAYNHFYAKNSDMIMKATFEKLDKLEDNIISQKENDIRNQCIVNPKYSKKIKNLLDESGKTSILELSLKEILTPEDFSEYTKNKVEIIASGVAAKNKMIEEIKADVKHNKIKSIVVGAIVGAAISSILPLVKYINREKNEDSANNKIQ